MMQILLYSQLQNISENMQQHTSVFPLNFQVNRYKTCRPKYVYMGTKSHAASVLRVTKAIESGENQSKLTLGLQFLFMEVTAGHEFLFFLFRPLKTRA